MITDKQLDEREHTVEEWKGRNIPSALNTSEVLGCFRQHYTGRGIYSSLTEVLSSLTSLQLLFEGVVGTLISFYTARGLFFNLYTCTQCYFNFQYMYTIIFEADEKNYSFSNSQLHCVSLFVVSPVFPNFALFNAELIYKEVLDWEERTKNGVIRGQPASIG